MRLSLNKRRDERSDCGGRPVAPLSFKMGAWCKLHTPATLPAAAIGSQIRTGISNPVYRGAHYTDWAIQTAVLFGVFACFTAKSTPRLLYVTFQGLAL